MKKLLIILLSLTLVFAFAACAANQPAEDTAADSGDYSTVGDTAYEQLPDTQTLPEPGEDDATGIPEPPEETAATAPVTTTGQPAENLTAEGEQPSPGNPSQEMQEIFEQPTNGTLVAGGSCDIEFSITIAGQTFTNEDAANLTVYTCNIQTATAVEATTNTWVGYKLKDVLDYLGVSISGDFWAIASDGYMLTFDTSYINDTTMIAVSKNGSTGKMPTFAPCGDSMAAKYISNLSEITPQ